jgi:MFS family permease
MSDVELNLVSRLKRAAIPEDGAMRTLSLATMIQTFGIGLFTTVEVIYFTFFVGLSPNKVALGLSIAGGMSLLFSVPAGHIADRIGPRDIAALSYLAEGGVLIGFVFVRSFIPFLLLSVLIGVISSIGRTPQQATIARLGTGEARVKLRAYLRAVTNMGLGLGTVFAGFALAINTRTGYVVMLLLDALTFFITALVWRRLPYAPPTVERGEPLSFVALKDKKYLGATLLNGIMSLHFIIQSVAIPLWVVRETNAPRWWVSVIMLVNTISVVLFQVRASKGAGDVNDGARMFSRAGLSVAAGCLLYALSSGVSAILASFILVIASLVHVAGELVGSAGSWSIGFGLADEKHQGQYQGVYSLGRGLGGAFGPAVVTALAIGMGRIGWVILGGIFSITGLLMCRLVTGSWSMSR